MYGIKKEGAGDNRRPIMKHLKSLLVLTMAVALVVVIAPGLLAMDVEKITEDVAKINEDVAKININKASVDELTQLKFIGPKLAERIVQYRTEHGPFERVEDVLKVKGIGSKALDANMAILTVE
jgi:competence ComEA-like helix-hairpin-helix protein